MAKPNTRIRFWAGLRTIGGTIATIEHGDSRIVFDFGRCFIPAGVILESGLAELADPAADYLHLGLLPPLDHLYAEASIKAAKSVLAPAGTGAPQQAVFISHLHLDHMALMGMIDPSVPVLMSPDSLRLYEALQSIGEGVPTVPGRTFNAFEYAAPAVVGEISVTPLRVDHDVAGACAFLVETPELRLLYTGDFRTDGNHPEWTEGMAREARRRKIDLLLMEGTTVGMEQDEGASPDLGAAEVRSTEGSMAERLAAAMREAPGLAVINLYHRNMERIEALFAAADRAGRTVVLEPETARLLQMLTGRTNLAVLAAEPVDGCDGCILISQEAVNAAPGRYAVQNSFARILRLLRLRAEGAVYIHSNGTPLGAYDPGYSALRDLLRRLGFHYRYIGASGHARPEQLRQVGEQIGADWFIPLHSLHPELVELPAGLRLLPEYGKTYSFRGGKPVTEEET